VAHVRDGFSPQTNIVRQDGVRSTLISILKNGGSVPFGKEIFSHANGIGRQARSAEKDPVPLKMKDFSWPDGWPSFVATRGSSQQELSRGTLAVSFAFSEVKSEFERL
jgi:hypothetical protein